MVRLRATYLVALQNAQAVPIVVPPLSAEGAAASLLDRADALVLTGGEDVNPARYGAAPHPRLGAVSDERDAWEISLVREARRRALPVLAICRGVQILNVALGGTLIQDIPSEISHSPFSHDPDEPRDRRTHPVSVLSDSRTAAAIGVTSLEVNSVHHQAIQRAAAELRIVATAPDGVIEAVESAPDSAWWCVGVQWHPEDLVDEPTSLDRGLFDALVRAARARSVVTRSATAVPV